MSGPASRQARLVAREAGGVAAAHVVGGGMRYIAAACAARAIGAAGYGTYTLSLTITAIASLVAGMGMSPGVLPFLSQARRGGDPREIRAVVRASLALALGLSAALALLLFALAPQLAAALFHDPALAHGLRSLAALVVLAALLATIVANLQGFQAVKEAAWTDSVIALGVTAAGMALTWSAGWGWPGVVGSTLAGPAAGILVGALRLARLAPRAPGATGPGLPLGPLAAYSWPLMVGALLSFLLGFTDLLLMGVFRPVREVGIYGVASRLATGVLLAQESLAPIFQARLSDHFVAGDEAGMRHLYDLTARWAMWPGLASAAALVLWAGDWLSLFGPEFVAGAAPLIVLAVGKGIAVAAGPSGRFFAITGRTRLNMADLAIGVAVGVALQVAWIPRHGALGAAAASSIALLALKVLQVTQVWTLFRMLPWNRKSLVPVVGIALLALAAYPLRHAVPGRWGWLVPAAAFGLACLALFLAVGVSADDRAVWRAVRSEVSGRAIMRPSVPRGRPRG